MTTLIAFVLVIICMIINLYATDTDKLTQLFSPQYPCNPEVVITAEQALEDQLSLTNK